jgi:hypothetical protein
MEDIRDDVQTLAEARSTRCMNPEHPSLWIFLVASMGVFDGDLGLAVAVSTMLLYGFRHSMKRIGNLPDTPKPYQSGSPWTCGTQCRQCIKCSPPFYVGRIRLEWNDDLRNARRRDICVLI